MHFQDPWIFPVSGRVLSAFMSVWLMPNVTFFFLSGLSYNNIHKHKTVFGTWQNQHLNMLLQIIALCIVYKICNTLLNIQWVQEIHSPSYVLELRSVAEMFIVLCSLYTMHFFVLKIYLGLFISVLWTMD